MRMRRTLVGQDAHPARAAGQGVKKDVVDDPNAVTGEVEITAGTQFEVPVQAYEGCILTWSFQTVGGDISFGAVFVADEESRASMNADDEPNKATEALVAIRPGEEIVLSENRRYHSDEIQVQGTVQIARSGTINLKWDNSFSFFRGKTLKYSVELEEPLGSELGPRALGGPSVPQIIFVLGGPGGGKGTQCSRLAHDYGFFHVSAGDLLRSERNDPDSLHGAVITRSIKEGTIAPVAITVALLWKSIRESGRRFILVDGFPRNRDNLEGWQRKIGGRAHILGCLSFEAPDETLIERLLERAKVSGRDDDNAETIRKRLITFHEETKPILEYFEKKGDLLRVNANRSREEVFDEIRDQLKLRIQSELPPKDEYIFAAPENRFAPRVVLGTSRIGGEEGMQEAEAKEYIREFTSSAPGCDEVDTARVYCNGQTEKLLGSILVSSKSRVSTKVNAFRGSLSPNSIAAQVGESLAALRCESLDILYLPAPDPSVPIEQTLEACDALYRKGRFRELGLANFAAWQVVNAYHVCASRGWIRPTVYQGMYHALARGVEAELIPALRTLGIRFYAANPLGGGLLTTSFAKSNALHTDGRYADKNQRAVLFRERHYRPSYIEALSLLEKSCERFEVSVEEAALRWLAHHSALRTTRDDELIITGSKPAHIKEDVHFVCGAGPLPLPLVVAIDRAWEMCKADCPSYFYV